MVRGAAERFKEQVQLAPDSIALRGLETLSYSQLDQRANRLAHFLKSLGARPEAITGIYLDRGAEAIVAILAVLKAGGAFLPLDPAYPLRRLRYMVQDSRLSLLISKTPPPEELSTPGSRTVDLDADAAGIAAMSDSLVEVRPVPDQLAYVIYTSGSTGRPKGVMVPQRGLANLLAWQPGAFGVEPADRILQFAPHSFDASVFEIFMALTSGASLVVEGRAALEPGLALLDTLARHEVTVVTLPPSSLAVMPRAPLPRLRLLIVGGEACPRQAVLDWAPGRRFVNAYGPTEASVCVSTQECTPAESGPPPIGSPITGCEAHVLDPAMRPVGEAAEGELYVGGDGVARGYLGLPSLTAERFLPDPFGPPGSRLYRTGDLVRRAGHVLEFIGRSDQQVKVRGFRVELGEVESVLLEHPAVRQAAVEAVRERQGTRLVAYVVPASGAPAPTVTELRRWLTGRLAEHLIPAAFITLASLPLTPSGKIDRSALPPPPAGRPPLDAAFIPPATQSEERVAAIWREVLQLDRVGVLDPFLELGGDSLMASQVVARLRAELAATITVGGLLDAATVSNLVRLIQDQGGGPQASLAPLRRRRPASAAGAAGAA